MKFFLTNSKLSVVFAVFSLTLLLHFQAKAQVHFAFAVPQDVYVCGDEAEFSFTFNNITNDYLDDISTNVTLATGLSYVPGSLTVISAPAGYTFSEFDISNLGSPVFAGDDLPALAGVQFTVRARVACSAIGVVNKFNTISVTATIPSNPPAVYTANSPSFNIQNAVLSITSVSPATATVGLGIPYTRTLTITNGGIGYTKSGVLNINFCGSVVSTNVGTLSGSQITFSAAEISAIGNGDAYWDLNETLTLTITLVSTNCACTSELYTISWGCNGNTCQSNTATAFLTPVNDRPAIGITLSRGAYPTSSCISSDVITITFSNNATETIAGAGAAFNLDMRFGWDRGGTPRNTPERRTDLIVENFHIQGTPFTPTTGATTFGYQVPNSVLNVPHGGLQDLNGDGVFNDLPAGASVSFTMTVRYVCLTACNAEVGRRVLTGWVLAQSPQCTATTANMTFANSNTISTATLASAGAFILANDRNTSSNALPPTIIEGEPTTVTICMDSELRNFNCPTDELVLMVQKVPGYTLTTVGGNPCIPKNVTIDAVSDPGWFLVTPNPVVGYTAPNPRTNNRFDDLCLSFNLIMNCSAPGFNPATVINYRFRYICDNSCPCTELHSCATINIPNKVCLNCPSGVLNSTFELTRTTLGWTDRTKTTLITPDPCLHRLDRAMSCDIVQMTATGQVIDNSWSNMRFEMSYTSAYQIFNFAGNAQLIVNDVSTGNNYVCPLPAPAMSVTSPFTAVFNFSTLIGTCLPAGFVFEAGDMLRIDADFSVIKTMSLPVPPTDIANLRGRFIANNGSDVSCPPLSEVFQVHRPAYNLTNTSNNVNIVNCGANYINLDLEMLNNTGDDYPSEFRGVSAPISVSLTLPAGFEFVTLPASPHQFQGFTPNITHNIPATAYTISGNTITYDCTGFPLIDKTSGRFQRIRVPIRITECTNANLTFSVSWTHRNYDYADAACKEVETLNITRNIRSDLNELVFSNLPVVVDAFTNYETFTFDLGAPNLATAVNCTSSWFSLSNPNLVVTKIEDITGAPFNVPVLSAGAGTYWAQVGTINNGVTRRYRVHFRWTTCSDFTINMRAAWSCFGYPVTPLAHNCENVETANVPVSLKNASFQGAISPTSPVGICDSLQYELTLVNADLEYIRNLSVSILYPLTGMTFVAGSAEMQYPSSAPFVPIPDPSGGTTWNLNPLNGKFALGMPGVTRLDSNMIKIRFKLKLNCEFIIGDNPAFTATGQRMCGSAVNTPVIVASPPQIIGAVQPYGTTIQFTGSNLQVSECAQTDTMTVKIINQGVGTTSNQDYVFFDLPSGFSYSGGYVAGHNSPAVPVLTTTLIGGITRLRFKLNPGVAANDSIIFSFQIGSDPNLTCGSYDIVTRSVIEQGLFCSTTQEVCENVTVQTGGNTFAVQVAKPDIQANFTNIQYVLTDPAAGLYQIALYGTIQNIGTVGTHSAGSLSLTIDFYCDKGTTYGTLDGGDNFIASYTTNINIPAGGSITLDGVLLPQTFTASDCNKWYGFVWNIEQNKDLNTANQQCLCTARQEYVPQDLLLPLAWLEISAKAKETSNLITWKVIESSATESYAVEKLISEKDWAVIGEVAAEKKRAGETFSYNFEDKNPKIIEYYRIRSTESDGKISYSKTVKAVRGKIEGEFLLYPNPAQNQVFVITSEDAEMTLLDVLGREMMKAEIKSEVENAINIEKLIEGTYFFQLRNNSGTKVLKFVKQN